MDAWNVEVPLKPYRFVGLDRDVWLPPDIQVIVDIVPARFTNIRSNTPFTKQVHLVYHETGNRSYGANALSERNYLHGGAEGRSVGYNFAVDDKRIVQLLPLNEVTWHAGKPWWNQHSWGIEQCVGGGVDLANARRNAAALHGALCAAKGWDVDHAVVMHKAVYGKHCPEIILDNGLWPSVRAEIVAARLASLNAALPAKEPTTSGPLIPYPDGLNRSLASRLFSFVIGDDDVKYAFNESGPISNLWLSYGIENGRWPRLEDVVIGADKTKVFIFSDGSVVVDTITAPPVYL